jgi:hypothetical protein
MTEHDQVVELKNRIVEEYISTLRRNLFNQLNSASHTERYKLLNQKLSDLFDLTSIQTRDFDLLMQQHSKMLDGQDSSRKAHPIATMTLYSPECDHPLPSHIYSNSNVQSMSEQLRDTIEKDPNSIHLLRFIHQVLIRVLEESNHKDDMTNKIS